MGYGETATHATLTRTFAGSSPATPVQSLANTIIGILASDFYFMCRAFRSIVKPDLQVW